MEPSPCFSNFLARTTFVLESLRKAKNPGQDAFFLGFTHLGFTHLGFTHFFVDFLGIYALFCQIFGYLRTFLSNFVATDVHALLLNPCRESFFLAGSLFSFPCLSQNLSSTPDLVSSPPSQNLQDSPVNAVTTRFVKTATNKMRCPIFCLSWTPEGRRLITGG